MKVNGYDARVNALRFKNSYKDLVDDLQKKIGIFMMVFKQTKEDKLLRDVLEWVLAVGNFMNG